MNTAIDSSSFNENSDASSGSANVPPENWPCAPHPLPVSQKTHKRPFPSSQPSVGPSKCRGRPVLSQPSAGKEMEEHKSHPYEAMVDKDSSYSESKDPLGYSSAKRRKDESASFDSLDTLETSHERSQRQKSLFTPDSDSQRSSGFLECAEQLGVKEKPATIDTVPQVQTATIEEAKPDLEVIGADTLNYLICREQAYMPDPYYIEKSQPELTWTMRLILSDWMMEVCMEFLLKRETYHYALNFVDRFLTNVPRVGKADLQLVGVTALYLAAKQEEVCVPKIKDFARATDNGYTVDQIRSMELFMAKNLRWELAPPTLNMWTNWYIGQWDAYIQYSEYARNNELVRRLEDPMVVFKQPNQKSYARYRELCQLVDLASLDITTLQYSPRALIASALYVLLAFHFGQATKEDITGRFTQSSSFVTAPCPFNDLLAHYLQTSFGYELPELLPTIQYISPFMALPFSYVVPTVRKQSDQTEENFEEFVSYQTHHPQQLEFVRYKPR